MRRYFTRIVTINALIWAVFGAAFAIPLGRLEIGFVAGLLFGVIIGLLIEVSFHRWQSHWFYRRRLLFLVLLEVLLLLYVLIPAYLAYFGTRLERIPVTDIPSELADKVEEVSLLTSDNITLTGWYIPGQNGVAIITLHGLGGNRLGVLPHARMLIEQGYGVLMMDMRAHGTSGGEMFADGWNAAVDVNAMVDYLNTRPEVEHIAALGLSAGAVSVLHAGAENTLIEAVVADGTGVAAVEDLLDPLIPHPAIAWLLVPQYWMSYRFLTLFSGTEAAPPLREQVKRIVPRSILFIAGAESMWEPELAAKYAISAGSSAQVWVVPGTEHGAGIFTRPDEYEAQVRTFLETALRRG